MKIDHHRITVRELVEGFSDDGDGGVTGYGGKLDIRPPYQREFVYDEKDRAAVIDTASKRFPLNVMYWSVREDGRFEVIDGQQRTISLAQYVNGDFAMSIFGSKDKRYFSNLQKDEQDKLLDYELMVYFCEGDPSERLAWFETINIAGKVLTKQELRNASFAGPWVSDAKRHFSRNGCPAYAIASDLMSGAPIRQDYLETAIKWISNDAIDDYMGTHQKDPQVGELWLYFQAVVAWVRATFPTKRGLMKGLPWGDFYNRFKDQSFDSAKLEARILELIQDEDITNQKGIYEFLLTGEDRFLNIRGFSPSQRQAAYARQGGLCAKCGKPFELADMDADHITPWIEGGKTEASNCQMLCKFDNRSKGAR